MWKGLLFFIIAAATIIIGLYSLARVPYAESKQSGPLPFEINYAERVKKQNAGIPSYIQIPSLYLFANIEKVKRDDKGMLSKPVDSQNAGWFAEENQRLGNAGVMIISGDFDDADGNPGIFYYLGSLEKKDKIIVTDLNGKKYDYTVIDKSAFNANSTDIQTLITKSQYPKLDLILYPSNTSESASLIESKTIIYAELK